MVAPLKNGELEEDLGECGVRGLRPSELWAPGVKGEEVFPPAWRVDELKSRVGTVECLEGILALFGVGSESARGARTWGGNEKGFREDQTSVACS
jgi:hypothetical protein